MPSSVEKGLGFSTKDNRPTLTGWPAKGKTHNREVVGYMDEFIIHFD
jgi:hypothetical protein